MEESKLYIRKSAEELQVELDLVITYLVRIAAPGRGFINRRALAAEALTRIEKP